MLLREAAATFSRSGEVSILPSTVIAALLGVLARHSTPCPRPRWPARFFDGTHQPPTISDSLQRLGAPSVMLDWDEIETALTRVIAVAASDWAEGDPERPETRVVLRELFEILWVRRLIPHPPSKQYPRGA